MKIFQSEQQENPISKNKEKIKQLAITKTTKMMELWGCKADVEPNDTPVQIRKHKKYQIVIYAIGSC